MTVAGACATTSCVPGEEVAGAVTYGVTLGDIPRDRVVVGEAVVVFFIVERIPYASKIIRPNRAFITSIEPKNENEEQGFVLV